MTYFHGTTANLTTEDLILPGAVTGNGIHARIDHIYMTKTVIDYSGPEHGTEYCSTGADTDDYCDRLEETGVSIRGTEDYPIGAALFWGILGRKMKTFRTNENQNSVRVYIVEPLGETVRDDYPELGPEIVKSRDPAMIIEEVSESEIARILPHVINSHEINYSVADLDTPIEYIDFNNI